MVLQALLASRVKNIALKTFSFPMFSDQDLSGYS